ncbi:MAG: CinA family protein [Clostridia bacterium]
MAETKLKTFNISSLQIKEKLNKLSVPNELFDIKENDLDAEITISELASAFDIKNAVIALRENIYAEESISIYARLSWLLKLRCRKLKTIEQGSGGLIASKLSLQKESELTLDSGIVFTSNTFIVDNYSIQPSTITSFGLASREIISEITKNIESSTKVDICVVTLAELEESDSKPYAFAHAEQGCAEIAIINKSDIMTKQIKVPFKSKTKIMNYLAKLTCFMIIEQLK